MNTVVAGCRNVTTFAVWITVNTRVSGVAAAKLPLAVRLAVIEHEPPATNEIMPAEVTVQTPVEFDA